jgi:hypothetical protein
LREFHASAVSEAKNRHFQPKLPVFSLLNEIIRSGIAIFPVKNGVFGPKTAISSPTSAFLPEKRRF